MLKNIFFCLLFVSPLSYALEITESKISGKWNVEAILMGALGELPAGKNDFFEFKDGNLRSAAQGELSEATYKLEENKIVVFYPNKKEVLTVTKLTDSKMSFFVDVFVNDKKMSVGNISFKLNKAVSGN